MNETNGKDVVYPEWVNNIFLMFALNYDRLWTETMPDIKTENIKKLMWMDSLKNFNDDTIIRAAKKALLMHSPYPPRIADIFKLCDEISKTNRYVEFQIEHKPEEKTERKELSVESQSAIDNIRQFVRSQKGK